MCAILPFIWHVYWPWRNVVVGFLVPVNKSYKHCSSIYLYFNSLFYYCCLPIVHLYLTLGLSWYYATSYPLPARLDVPNPSGWCSLRCFVLFFILRYLRLVGRFNFTWASRYCAAFRPRYDLHFCSNSSPRWDVSHVRQWPQATYD